MIWAGITWRGKTELVIVDCNMNAEKYLAMLQAHLEPFIQEYYPKDATFNQHGAPAHSVKFTRDYFAAAEITDMERVPQSPDMNPIDNRWATLALAVYDNGRQFDTTDDLKEALFYESEKLEQSEIQKLISSMPRRIWEPYSGGTN